MLYELSKPYHTAIRKDKVENANELIEHGYLIDSPPNLIITRKLLKEFKEMI